MSLAGHLRERRTMRRAGLVAVAIAIVLGLVLYEHSRAPATVYSGTGPHPFKVSNKGFGTPIKLPQSALDTAKKFLQTAVLRRDPAASWNLVTPAMRQGFTKARWASGDIPVTPFPAYAFGQAKFAVSRSRSKNIMLKVAIGSTKNSVQAAYDFLEMVPSGKRWLVSYFAPVGYTPPVPAPQ